MRIFIITSEFPPSFGGGISMYVEQIAKAYAKEGHHITVITRSENTSILENIEPNYRVYRFQHCNDSIYGRMGYWPALSFDIAQKTQQLIEDDGISPDIIEVQDYNALGYYVLQRRFCGEPAFEKIKLVVHLHTPTFKLAQVNKNSTTRFPDYWIGEMERFCIAAADGVVTQSKFLAKDLGACSDSAIEVIPLPYHMDEKAPRCSESTQDILYIGRFEYRKGVVQLLKEFKNLWDEGIKAKLVMIGGDTYFSLTQTWLREECKKKYAQYISDGMLVILDPIPPEDLCKLIQRSKFVVIPSLYENYPYACLMSMANRKTVLVSASGGQAEMAGEDEQAGLIFNWKDGESFRKQIQRLLNLPDDRLSEMGDIAFERIRELTDPSSNVAARIDFFNKVLARETKKFPLPDYVKRLSGEALPGSLKSKKCSAILGRLSIIIPFYNLGKYLEETVESAISVDFKNKEIIIINDGSSDPESIDALAIVEKRYPDIHIVNIVNGGLANARNVGAQHATGEFITFLDADDLVDATFYSKAIRILESHKEISFVYSWLEYFEGASGVWPTYNTALPFMACANMLSAFCVVRKSDFVSFGLNDVDMDYGMEDYESWLRMVGNGCIGLSIPEVLVKYRVRADSMSRQFNRNMQRYLYEKLSNKNCKIYKEYGQQIFQLICANGPGYFWNNPTFEHPELQFIREYSPPPAVADEQSNYQRNELLRISESKLGKKVIALLFKSKLNKIFRN